MAFTPLSFTKDWTNAVDFPTYEANETKVREDMQFLYDEIKDYINDTLIEALEATTAAANLGALLNSQNTTIQNALNSLFTGKVNTQEGKGLSSNDYTTEEKTKLAGAEITQNKVTSVSGSSTDTEYPSAKCLYDALAGKQAALVSGTNIKTINEQSILGSGDLALQAALVSGTNIKTINEQSILGSGNLALQAALVSGTNIKTINEQSILGSGNLALQAVLVSGTNIKTINNQSILGSGNLDIGGQGTTDYTDLTNKPQINGNTLSGNKTSAQLGLYGTGNAPPYPVTSVNGQTGDVTTGDEQTSNKVTSVSSSSTNTQYPSAKCLYDALAGKQAVLVSGTNIKEINNQSILGSGNLELQAALVSGTNIKTINSASILGSGNITTGDEQTSNKVTSISSSSTDTQYPSAKCVYDIVGNVEAVLDSLM